HEEAQRPIAKHSNGGLLRGALESLNKILPDPIMDRRLAQALDRLLRMLPGPIERFWIQGCFEPDKIVYGGPCTTIRVHESPRGRCGRLSAAMASDCRSEKSCAAR